MPLSGARVLEIADDLPARWCARQFAAWGAEVVIAGSRREPRDDWEAAVGEYVDAGKRVTSKPLAGLVAGADVVVTDRPVVAAPAGAVVVSLRWLSGAYAGMQGTDLVAQALSGYMSLNGEPGRPPLRAPANLLPYFTGTLAFAGALAALFERSKSRTGQVVEVSALEAIATLVPWTRTEYLGKPDRRLGYAWTGQRLHPAKDEMVCVFPLSALEQITDALLVCGVDVDVDARPALPDYEGVIGWVERHMAQAPAEQFVRALWDVDRNLTLYHRVHTPGELPRHEQMVARGFYFDVDHRRLGRVPFAGPAARLSATPMRPPVAVTDGDPSWGPREGDAATPSLHPPLRGVRIVDMTQAWAGPYATMLLADLGAEVIKVEGIRRPDGWRTLDNLAPVQVRNADAWKGNVNPLHNSVNRNKRSLTLDTRQPRGRELLGELIAKADAVVENFKAGTFARMGFDDERVRALNPRAILASFSGYGRTGPYAGFRANGTAIETVGGWNSMHGYTDGRPMQMGFYQADAITGLHLAVTTLLALLDREVTGRVQSIDGDMFEAAAGYVGDVTLYEVLGGTYGCRGNRDLAMAPHGAFRCTGEDEWVAIAVRDDADWKALVVAAPALDDERYATRDGRLAHEDLVEAALEAWTVSRSARDVMDALQGLGVPAGVVLRTDQALDDAGLKDWFIPMHHEDMGTHRYAGFPWRFSRSRLEAHTPPPRLGEHHEAILRDELGLSDAQIAKLREDGVTGAVLVAADEPPPA